MWKWETHRDVISELNNLLVCGELQWLEVAPGSRMHKHPQSRYQHRPLCMLSQWHRHTAHFMFRKLNIQLWHMLNLLYHHHCIMQRKPSPPLTTDEIFKCSATYEGRNTTKLWQYRVAQNKPHYLLLLSKFCFFGTTKHVRMIMYV